MLVHKRKILYILVTLSIHLAGPEKLSRQKRLIWPKNGSKIQLITGYGVAVPELERETIIFGTVLKCSYKLPINTTQLRTTPITYEKRRKRRAFSRWSIYRILQQAFELHGIPGKSCLLKMICELAHTPLDKSNGLYEELMHLILTPTSTSDDLIHYTDNEYYGAQQFGKMTEGNCDANFPDCKIDLINVFTF